MLKFWGAVFGPFRPYGYPDPGDSPSVPWFLAGMAVCFAPLLFPTRYFRCWEKECGVRAYELVGVRFFKRFVTNGDLINQWARKLDQGYRLIRGQQSAQAWTPNTDQGERSHLVLLLMGFLTAGYAVRIGWLGWVAALVTGNLIFNLYPVLLQRYLRCRIERLLDSKRSGSLR